MSKPQITLVVLFSVTTYTSMFKPHLHLTQMFKLKPHKTRTSVFKPQSHLTLQSSIHSYNLNIHDQTTVTPYTSMLMPKFLLTHQFQIFSHINIQTTVTSITSMIKSQSKIQAIVTSYIEVWIVVTPLHTFSNHSYILYINVQRTGLCQ